MLKKTFFALTAAVVTLVPVSVSADTSYNLSLHVPVMCSIIDAYATDPQQGLITVVTNCNAENYGISFGGSLDGLSVISSSNSNGSAIASADSVTIRASSPGISQTQIRVNGDLSGITGATLSLSAY